MNDLVLLNTLEIQYIDISISLGNQQASSKLQQAADF